MSEIIKKQLPNLLAASLFALAASISYFTYELSFFIRQIPDILENVRVTSEKMEPALNELGEIQDLIKPIIIEVNGIREQIPAILREVEKIRETIPPILESIPPILNESAEIRKQLPDALSSVNDASASVVLFSTQLNDYQPIVNEALVQVDGTRKEIPVIMNRADAMIDRAHSAAKDVSTGVVTNAVGGLLTAPFRLVGNIGSSVLNLTNSEIKDYSKEDLEQLKNLTQEILQNESLSQGETKSWKNPDTQRRFEVTKLKSFTQNSRACRELKIKSWENSDQTLNKNIVACKNEDGKWENID